VRQPDVSTHMFQVEQAQLAHLCTVMSNMHHRRAGYPFGTIVDFASDGAGFPIFALSPLAIHTRNLMEDARCCLVVQMPGWNGLANARVTIFGDVYQLPPELQGAAQEVRSPHIHLPGPGV
jgi:putative heme iron utilization protein